MEGDFHYEFSDEQARESFVKNLNDFRRDGIFCDVTLSSEEGREYRSHKVILASSSSYFRAMFRTEMKESQQAKILIKQIDSKCLESLVEFAYTAKIKITPGNVELLLSAASLLQFNGVERACFDFLTNNMDASNAMGIWALGERYGFEDVAELAEVFIRSNFSSVTKQAEFLNLNLRQFQRLLSHDKLKVSCESEVYRAVLTWVKHDLKLRASDLPQLLEHVRLPLMTRRFLIDHVAKEELLMKETECRKFVVEALDYHLIPERRGSNPNPRMLPRDKCSRALYALGGEGENHAVLNSVEWFDFQDKIWKNLAPMIIPRKHLGSAVLDSQLYAVGGINTEYSDLVTVECYNHSMQQWVSVASLNKCKGALAVAVLEGWLYSAGGSHNGSSLKTVERYDPTRNHWTPVSSMRLPRSHFGIAPLQGKLYAVGGYCGISEIEHVEVFDPMTNKWTDVGGMNKARMNHGVVTYGDRIYVIGGNNSMGVLDSIEKYNPDLNLWLIIRNTMDPRTGACVLPVYSNKEDVVQELFIVGGHNNQNRELKTVKRLNLKFGDYNSAQAPALSVVRVFAGSAWE